MKENYKYIYLTLDGKEPRFLYSGFESIENGTIVYIDRGAFLNRLTRPLIQKYSQNGHFSLISKFLTGGIIRKQITSNSFDKSSDELVFVLYARVYETFGRCITDELRKAYPNCVICVYFGDILKWFSIPLETYRRDFDYVFSFDRHEADLYDMHFLQEPFSYKPMGEESETTEFDVTYVGDARTPERYEAIIKVFEQCKSAGLKCDFHITCVSPENQKYPDEIVYNSFMSFEDIVKRVIRSKTVLEIVQNGGCSPTTRYAEACIYGRNLLTNCAEIKEGVYPKDDNIFILDNDMRIDTSWIREIHPIDRHDYIRLFSIESFVDEIGNVINNT